MMYGLASVEMTDGVRLVCGFVGTGRVVTGGIGDERS